MKPTRDRPAFRKHIGAGDGQQLILDGRSAAMKRWAALMVMSAIVTLSSLHGSHGQAHATSHRAHDLAIMAVQPGHQRIDVGGYLLHIYCVGQGHPTVIMESGSGGDFL